MGGDVKDFVSLTGEPFGEVLDSNLGAIGLEGVDPEDADPQIGPAGRRRNCLAPRTSPLARRKTTDAFG
jgi:hypothetical protein